MAHATEQPRDESGEPDAATPPGAAGAVPVDTKAVCVSCAYPLAGLATIGACPECAYPIEKSLGSSVLLRSADPKWLETIEKGLLEARRASLWLVIGILVGVGVTAITTALAMFVRGMDVFAKAFASIAPMALSIGGLAVLAVCLFLHVRGSWRLGTPLYAPACPPARPRMVLRIAGIALPLAYVLAGVVLAADVQPRLPWRVAGSLAVEVAGVAYAWALQSVVRHLEGCSASTPESAIKDRRNARKNLVGLVVVLGLGWALAISKSRVTGIYSPILIGLLFASQHTMLSRVHKVVSIERGLAR